MRISEFFKKPENNSQKLADELRSMPAPRKRPKVVYRDSRNRPGAKVGPSRREFIQNELEKLNKTVITAFINDCVERMAKIPKLRIVHELSREKYHLEGLMGTFEDVRIVLNSDSLKRYENIILEAMSSVRELQRYLSTREIEAVIAEWKLKIESIDLGEVNEALVSGRVFKELTAKEPEGKTATGYISSNGEIQILRNDAEDEGRVKELSDRIGQLEKGRVQ